MLGGKNMGILPVTVSLVASHVSGILLLGAPAELYVYGTQYTAVFLPNFLFVFIANYVYLPVFYKLQVSTVYEYLELRFSHTTRVVGSLIFTISQIVYLPAIIYVPSLVLNQVSGFPVPVMAAILCGVGFLYTTFGGFKAVLWTDALQNMFSLFAVLFIIFLGINQMGGVGQILNACKDGSRIEFFDHVSGILLLGAPAELYVYGTQYTAVFLPNFLFVFIANYVYLPVFYKLQVSTVYEEIKKTGQLLPLYVMEVARGYPGLAGLFVSGVVSAALSSISAAIKTMAGSLYEDIVEVVYRGKKQSNTKQSLIMKSLSLLLGGICVCLVLLVDKTDSLFQIGMSLSGITNGALLSMFIMGIFIPRTNSQGAIAGALSSLAVMVWLVLNAQYYSATGQMRYPAKFTRVDQCPGNYSSDPMVISRLETYREYGTPVIADISVSLIYQISYMYYPFVGTAVGLLVGLLVSELTEPPNLCSMDRRLLSPYVHRYLPQLTPGTRSKSNSVRWAEEEFTLINFSKTPLEEKDENEVEEEMNGSVTHNGLSEKGGKVPPKEDINKPE